MTQVTLSQLISHLQAQLEEHGDVPVYIDVDAMHVEVVPCHFDGWSAQIRKIYEADGGEIHSRWIEEEGFPQDALIGRPITKGLVL